MNPKRYPDLNIKGVRALKNWLVSKHDQQLNGEFKVFIRAKRTALIRT